MSRSTKGLAVGDLIVIQPRHGRRQVMRVDKVTPTGRIVVEGGMTFNPDGNQRGGRYDTAYITEETHTEYRDRLQMESKRSDLRRRILAELDQIHNYAKNTQDMAVLEEIAERYCLDI